MASNAAAGISSDGGISAAPSWSVLSDSFSFGSTRLKEGGRGKEEAVAFDTDGLEIGEFSDEEDEGEGEEEEDEDLDDDDLDDEDEDELDEYE